MAIIVINPYQYAAPIGPSADPYSDYVSLLLHGNGTNNSTTVTDSSSYNHAVTPVADAKISTTQNKFGGASIYLDGSGDCLSLPDDQSAFNFGTGDFTIECWIYWVGGAYGIVFSQRHAYSTNDTGMSWRIDDLNDTIGFWHGNGLDGFGTPNYAISKNTWTHIALTRNGSTFTIWVNGQSEATNTITANMIYYPPVIGRSQGVLGEYLNAYLDDYRITKGVARYTSNFNPPTAELPDPSDPDFDSVSLLLHGDGTNGSTTFIDSSNNSHTVTANGGAQISTTQSKFGGASMYFDGSGDYLTATDSSFAFGTGEFTIEFWMRAASVANSEASLSVGSVGTSNSWQISPVSSGTELGFVTGISVIVSTSHPSLNTWHHVAVVRDSSNVVTLYLNGTNVDSATNTNNYSANNLRVGVNRNVSAYYHGYIDDLRITKGVARYTSNFTPPTAPLPDETPPIVTDGLVLHLDAGDSTSYPGSGTVWTDLSNNGNNGALTNGPTYDSSDGGSIVFDGDNDFVDLGTIGVSHPLQLNNGFTISWWGIQGGGGDLFQRIIDKSDAGLAANGWAIYPRGQTTPESQLTLNYNGIDGTINSSTNISSTSWQNWSLTWSSSSNQWIWYLNGSVDNSGSTTYNVPNVETNARIGSWNHSTGREYKGKISSFLIYTRPLTQSEVTQNFDALKKRYGL